MSRYSTEKIILKNNKEITFRTLEPMDAEKYIHFCDTIGKDTTHTLHYVGQKMSIESIKEKFENSINCPWQIDLGGFNKDVLISHLSFYKPRPNHPFESHTGEFGVKIVKDFCFLGLGSAMISRMERIAREMHVKRVQAKVRTSNHIGINFYRKHLYEIEGIKKQAAFINGLYEDEFYLAKILI